MRCKLRLESGHQIEPYFEYELEVPDDWVTPGMWPDHVAFFCPVTGTLWAWMEWLTPDASGWIIRRVPRAGQAPRHRITVPGSLIPADADGLPPDFPVPLLEREFLLHAEYFKKGYHHL